MSDPPEPAVRLRGISKAYPGVVANRSIDLTVSAGSIHGLLGENGAGKSTLMKILFGLVKPDSGTVEIDGRLVEIESPHHAIGLGIGMVQQHFSLIPVFTVAENLVLGNEPTSRGWQLDLESAEREIAILSDEFGFRIDPRQRVGDLTVGARQRVEILKALHRGAEILILDEPTAALTPQEADELHGVMRELRAQGRTVVFISHKLPEVIDLCDRVTVLRDGDVVGEWALREEERRPGPERGALEGLLARSMVGRELPRPPEHGGAAGDAILVVRGATDGSDLAPLDLEVRAGEIVGVAGVEGNGQGPLVELLLGVRRCVAGRIELGGVDISALPVARRLQAGIAHIAEDRHAAALVLSMPVAENSVLGFQRSRPFARGPFWLSPGQIARFARSIVQRFGVRTPSVRTAVGSLSGGNQQKLVVGRELAREPRLMIAAQPTRGLDIAASAFVHEELARMRTEGRAVLLVSLDLAEIMALADRIVVLSTGTVVGVAPAGEVDEETLGIWMTGTARAPERRDEPA